MGSEGESPVKLKILWCLNTCFGVCHVYLTVFHGGSGWQQVCRSDRAGVRSFVQKSKKWRTFAWPPPCPKSVGDTSLPTLDTLLVSGISKFLTEPWKLPVAAEFPIFHRISLNFWTDNWNNKNRTQSSFDEMHDLALQDFGIYSILSYFHWRRDSWGQQLVETLQAKCVPIPGDKAWIPSSSLYCQRLTSPRQ